MRRIIASAIVLASTMGAGAVMAQPGPNGANNFGLCKAYFSGSDQGRANKRNAPPFQALERAAGVEPEDTAEERDEKVREFCSAFGPGGDRAGGGDAGTAGGGNGGAGAGNAGGGRGGRP